MPAPVNNFTGLISISISHLKMQSFIHGWAVLRTAIERSTFESQSGLFELVIVPDRFVSSAENLWCVSLQKSKSGFLYPKTDFAFLYLNQKMD